MQNLQIDLIITECSKDVVQKSKRVYIQLWSTIVSSLIGPKAVQKENILSKVSIKSEETFEYTITSKCKTVNAINIHKTAQAAL